MVCHEYINGYGWPIDGVVHQWVWVAYRWCVYIKGYGWPIDGVSTSMGMGGL